MAFATRPITGLDPDASKVPAVDCTGCTQLSVAFASDVAGAQLRYCLFVADSLGNVHGSHPPVMVVSPPAANWGAKFVAQPTEIDGSVFHVCGGYAYIQVVEMNPTTAKWVLTASPV